MSLYGSVRFIPGNRTGKRQGGVRKGVRSDYSACGLQLFLRISGDAVSSGACRKAAGRRRGSGGAARHCPYRKLHREAAGSEDRHGALAGEAVLSESCLCSAENVSLSPFFPDSEVYLSGILRQGGEFWTG